MGIASFVVGLSCFILSPFLSTFLILPSLLGLTLGIIETIIQSKKGKSKGLSVAGIVLSAIALAVCVFFTIGTYMYSMENTTDSSGDIIPTEVTCNLGESATMGDIKITFKDVNLNYKDYDDYAYINKGNTVLKADFEFENIGNSNRTVDYYQFDCFADKFSYSYFYYIQDYNFEQTLKPGEKCTKSIYFEIPKNAKDIDIEYDNYYDQTVKKIIFNVKDSNTKNI